MNKNNIIEYITRVAEEMDDNEDLLREIENTKLEMESARSFFENVSDSNLVDVAIYSEAVAKKRYDYLISEARRKNVRVSNRYILDRCTRTAE